MKTPRVLCVKTSRKDYEGITMSIMRFARNIDTSKVHMDFAVICEPAHELRNEMENLGGRVYVLGDRLKKPIRYMAKLAGIVRKGDYDIVHVHGNSGTLAIELLAAWFGGAKVRIAHSHNSSCKYLKAHKLLRPLFNIMYTDALACGEEAGKWLFGKRPFMVVRNATETLRYAFDEKARKEYRKMLGLEGTLAIGSVAIMNEQKNHSFMLDVFAGLKKLRSDVRLVLVGDGSLRPQIEEKINALGLNEDVLVLGTRTDVPKIIQALDVMLLPSLHEGFPGVLVEWQCAGLRSLVSDAVTPSAALTELVEFLPINDITPWVEALNGAQADPERSTTSARAVMQIRARGYDIVRNAQELQKFYIEAANRGR